MPRDERSEAGEGQWSILAKALYVFMLFGVLSLEVLQWFHAQDGKLLDLLFGMTFWAVFLFAMFLASDAIARAIILKASRTIETANHDELAVLRSVRLCGGTGLVLIPFGLVLGAVWPGAETGALVPIGLFLLWVAYDLWQSLRRTQQTAASLEAAP